MNDLPKIFLGIAVGAVLVLGYQSVEQHSGKPLQAESELLGKFGEAIGFDGPMSARWRTVHTDNDLTFQVADDAEVLAISKGNEAVLLFSYVEGIRYFDIFENGNPRITAEIAPDQRRMFVYSSTDSWVYMDRDLDGVADQRLIPGKQGSAQDLGFSNLWAEEK